MPFKSSQDWVGGPQEVWIEEGTSKTWEGGCWGSRRREVKKEGRQFKGFVVLIEKLWFGNLAFFCYQARQSGPYSTVQNHSVYILQLAVQTVQMNWICRLGRYLMPLTGQDMCKGWVNYLLCWRILSEMLDRIAFGLLKNQNHVDLSQKI